MQVPFETFVERANRARTTEELVNTFLETTRQHGLDRMVFCLQTRHRGIDLEPGFGVLQNYPEDWMKYYQEKGYARIDPVTIYCMSKMETFTWAEIPQRMDMTTLQFKCLNLGIEAGLYNGVCTPLFGPNQFAGIGLASQERLDSYDGNLDLITAYCNYFYIVFQRINRRAGSREPNMYLTKREQDVLTWVADGKSDTSIASILNVTEHAVDYHLRKIFRKFDCTNRIVAICKALSFGLIRP